MKTAQKIKALEDTKAKLVKALERIIDRMPTRYPFGPLDEAWGLTKEEDAIWRIARAAYDEANNPKEGK